MGKCLCVVCTGHEQGKRYPMTCIFLTKGQEGFALSFSSSPYRFISSSFAGLVRSLTTLTEWRILPVK